MKKPTMRWTDPDVGTPPVRDNDHPMWPPQPFGQGEGRSKLPKPPRPVHQLAPRRGY